MERLQKEEERQLEKVRLKAEQKRRWKKFDVLSTTGD